MSTTDENVLADLIAPVREKLAQVQAELDQVERHYNALREAKMGLERVLRNIDPEAEPYRKNGHHAGRKLSTVDAVNTPGTAAYEKRERYLRDVDGMKRVSDALIDFWRAHPDEFGKGASASGIAHAMQAANIQVQGTTISDDRMRAAFHLLHEQGVIRALRKLKGGATAYGLVGE